MIKNKQEIEFTKEQFKTLLKLVYLGNWLANANSDGSEVNPYKTEYEKMEDFIFSCAKKFGLDELVDNKDTPRDKYFPTRSFEDETDVQQLIADYDDANFWDELIDRLGERDFLRLYSEYEIQHMSSAERIEKIWECMDKWHSEINKYGIERLEMK